MTQQEYEQKRRECWEEFCRHIIDEQEEFYNMFDRAYALGREKQTITQEDVEKAAETFADGMKVQTRVGVLIPLMYDIAKSSYLQGAQDFLGKQEKDADTVIIDKEEYDNFCKYRRYVANWVPNLAICPICGEYNPSGCICANCNNDKNLNNGK